MDFSLIETLRFDPATGFVRLNLHLARLAHSARQLGFAGADKAHDRLLEHAQREFGQYGATKPVETASTSHRVRLELFADGRITITSAPFVLQKDDTVWTVRIATTRLASKNRLLVHKTSRREIYDQARAEFSKAEADEVLLLNERGALCEGTITSLFVDDGKDRLLTPPLSAGLLAGVLRTSLLCDRKARVQTLFPEDLAGRTIYMGNSLRGLIRARLES